MLLAALDPGVRSHVIACMMATFESMFPTYLDGMSWLMVTPGLRSFSEWPLLPFSGPATSTDRAVHVQFARRDDLFSERGMEDADIMLASNARPDYAYSSSWWDHEHKLSRPMQDEIADFLLETLGS